MGVPCTRLLALRVVRNALSTAHRYHPPPPLRPHPVAKYSFDISDISHIFVLVTINISQFLHSAMSDSESPVKLRRRPLPEAKRQVPPSPAPRNSSCSQPLVAESPAPSSSSCSSLSQPLVADSPVSRADLARRTAKLARREARMSRGSGLLHHPLLQTEAVEEDEDGASVDNGSDEESLDDRCVLTFLSLC